MKPQMRSLTGALMMLAIIPIFAGLLACMPVPIGDPERSRVDPDLNGVWALESEGDAGELYLLQPYDKRTWLITGARIEAGPDYEGEAISLDTNEDAFAALEANDIGSNGITSPSTVSYKAWTVKLGGVTFMTWELVGGFSPDGSNLSSVWYVWRLEKRDANRFDLYILNPEADAFDEVSSALDEYKKAHEFANDAEHRAYLEKIRPRWERVLKKVAKNVDDDNLYGEAMAFQRVPADLMEKASRLFREVNEFEFD